jgi:hypothetical protein
MTWEEQTFARYQHLALFRQALYRIQHEAGGPLYRTLGIDLDRLGRHIPL